MTETVIPTNASAASSPHADLVDQIVGELGPLIARRQRSMTRAWCRQEINMVHLHVLLLLDTDGPLSMSRLAENIDVSLPNATGIVTRMEERGLVRRTHGEDDRRVVMVQLADAGRSALEEADYFRRQHITRALRILNDSQLKNLLRAVRDLRGAFDRLEPNPIGPATAQQTSDSDARVLEEGRTQMSQPRTEGAIR